MRPSALSSQPPFVFDGLTVPPHLAYETRLREWWDGRLEGKMAKAGSGATFVTSGATGGKRFVDVRMPDGSSRHRPPSQRPGPGWCGDAAARGAPQLPVHRGVIGDSGYQGRKMEAAVARTGSWELQIVRRCGKHRFIVSPKRWIVERTLAWISRTPPSTFIQRQACSVRCAEPMNGVMRGP